MAEIKTYEGVRTVLSVAFFSVALIVAAPVAGAFWLFKKAAALIK